MWKRGWEIEGSKKMDQFCLRALWEIEISTNESFVRCCVGRLRNGDRSGLRVIRTNRESGPAKPPQHETTTTLPAPTTPTKTGLLPDAMAIH